MKSGFYLLITFNYLLLIVHGWTSMEYVPMDPSDPTFCMSDDPLIGRLKLGESKSLHPHRCVRVTCHQEVIRRAGCGKLAVIAPYVIVPEDLSQPYPMCCPKIIRLDDILPLLTSDL